jgi:pyruvate/2-oxoglutarate dehydrogenase complex dihydrolipoamide acyltransferase (E2) component
VTIEVLLPKIGFSMTEGILVQWLVSDGAEVAEGQAICEMESDKSVQEVESPATGRLRIIARTGEPYAVGTVIAEVS